MKRNDRAIAAFTSLGHGTFHGLELAIPLFVPLWLAEFDASPTALGLVVAIGYALIGFVAPLAGVLADRYGSKRIVLVSIGGMGLAFSALSAASSLATLAAVLIVWGTAAGLYHPAGLSLISRGATRRGSVLAWHGAGGNLGMVIVPLAVVFLLLVVDWRTAAVVLVVPAALCVTVGFLLEFETHEIRDEHTKPSDSATRVHTSLRRFLRDTRTLFVGGFLLILAIQMVYGTYYRGIFTFLPDVLGDLPVFAPVAVGAHELEASQLAYSGLLLIGVFGQYAGGMLSDRRQPEWVLLATVATLTVASLLFVPAANAGLLPLLVICAILGFCIYAFAPVVQILVADYVADHQHGLSYGYVYLGTFGVGAGGAAIAGATLEWGGTTALFAVLAGLVALCAVLVGGLVAVAPASQ
ncbi:MFS transporter [Natronosalvus vescus]|uniref:MFS transporter n=1 Tax=Natronosalvus vescus TaxID=2953881 RepID=UPI0020907031|nr:MFS transporter [Natronosalvus vescus]